METLMLSRRGGIRVTLVVAALAVLSPWVDAQAQSSGASTKPASGEVLVILANEAAGPVDASLKKMEALQKPPFNGFKSMKVLNKQKLELSADTAQTAELPNGRRMQIELVETQKDGRYKVKVSINKPNTKDYLPGMVVVASPGEPFFVAGQKHEGGTLIIGIRIGDKAAKK